MNDEEYITKDNVNRLLGKMEEKLENQGRKIWEIESSVAQSFDRVTDQIESVKTSLGDELKTLHMNTNKVKYIGLGGFSVLIFLFGDKMKDWVALLGQ